MKKIDVSKGAPTIDIEQAREYCEAIANDENPNVHFAAIQQKPGTSDHGRTLDKYGPLDQVLWWAVEKNKQGFSPFSVLNQTDGKGRSAHNVTRVNGVWNDCDNGPPDRYPLDPSLRVWTSDDKCQDVWLVEGSMDFDDHARVLDIFVSKYRGDRGAKGLPRILRVPGFLNWKYGAPQKVRLEWMSERAYTAKKITRVFLPKTDHSKKPDQSTVLQALRGQLEFDADLLRDALAHISADDYATYWTVIAAIKRGSDLSEEGKVIAREWAKKSEKFDHQEFERRWARGKEGDGDRTVKLGTIFHLAKKNGWIKPALVEIETAEGREEREVRWPVPNPYGKPADHIANVRYFIRKLKRVKPWFNEFDGNYYLGDGNSDTLLTDAALRDLRMQMHDLNCKVSIDLMESGLKWLADKNKRHPLRDFIEKIEWDNVSRIDTWLSTYLGARDTKFTRAVGRACLVSGVRRLRKPGCLVRSMLVLEGPQNVGKSTVFKILAGEEYFSDSLPFGADAKETIEETVGKWIIEHAELSNKTKREVEEVKASISRTHDTARTAYARTALTVPRQFVMVGTTNNDKYLRDRTGNTRFWPVKVGRIDLDLLREDREQLWAEAAHYEALGEHHWLGDDLKADAAQEAAKREVVNPVEEKLADLLRNAPPGFVPSEELWKAIGLEEAGRRSQYHVDSMGDAARTMGWIWKRRRRGDGSKQVSGYLAPRTELKSAAWLYCNDQKKQLTAK